MYVLQKAINDIKSEIPRQILEIALLGRKGRRGRYAQSLDWFIKTQIIDTRIREDTDLLGAITDNIPLRKAEFEGSTENYKTVVRIPKTHTEGRDILEVLAFNYTYNNAGTNVMNNGFNTSSYDMRKQGNSPLMHNAARVLKSAGTPTINSTAAVKLIGPNTIGIDDFNGVVRQGSVTVRMAGDEGFTHIKPTTIPQFTKLCVLGAKAFIYNEMIIDLDEGYLDGGQEIGRVKEIVESYSDAREIYREYLEEEWTAVAFMNDDARYHTLIRGNIGNLG